MRFLVGLTTILALGVFGCNELPTEPAHTPDMRVRGVTLADWTADGYGSSAADAAIDEISLTGANALTFIVTAYQSSIVSNEVMVDPQRTPTQAAVSSAITKAKSVGAVGVLVALKPHVDLYDDSWRGNIKPSDVNAWFASYSAFILEWAVLAANLEVDQFVVGTELAGTLEHEDRWRQLIADVRAVFDGEMVYSASWDEAPIVPFWDAVDCVGINFYAPVTWRAETDRFSALSGWQPWLDRMRVIHKQADRDVLLTEVGYRSVDGAGMHPYDFTRDAAVDTDEQAHLYWAALQAVGDQPWVRGAYFWNWLIGASAQQESKDYTPRNKPAEEELRNAWTAP